jgi:hypothetical protein
MKKKENQLLTPEVKKILAQRRKAIADGTDKLIPAEEVYAEAARRNALKKPPKP